jgi:hypothetical protein
MGCENGGVPGGFPKLCVKTEVLKIGNHPGSAIVYFLFLFPFGADAGKPKKSKKLIQGLFF